MVFYACDTAIGRNSAGFATGNQSFCCRFDNAVASTVINRIAVGYRDACKLGATVERIASNARDTVSNHDTGKIRTTGERIVSNARDAVTNRDADKIRTIGERTVRNIPAGYRDRLQRGRNIVGSRSGRTCATTIIVL